MIIPAIMCGGAGTRLWPASRDSLPKHLIPLFGGLSTFQLTVQRFAGHAGFGKPVVITSADSRFQIGEQLAAIGVEADIILEPSRQDSAAAVATGALHCLGRGPDALCLMLAADHKVDDPEAFREACRQAGVAAATGLIMTLGITPTEPSTGYGYIRPGQSIGSGSFLLQEFREKPDAATAERYISEGYVWNSGNFLFRPDTMLAEFEAYRPDILTPVREAYGKAGRDKDFIRLDKAAFGTTPRISVDFAIMEKTRKAGVTPCSAGWSDIGTWDALWEALPRDGDGNAVSGDVVLHASRNTLVQSDAILTTAVGVEDMIIVASRDAVLVAPRSRSADVKDLVQLLKTQKRREATEHVRLHHPWGWAERLDSGERHDVRRLHILAGQGLSLECGRPSAAQWVVIGGKAGLTIDQQNFTLRESESQFIASHSSVRLSNLGSSPLEIIEVTFRSKTGS